MARSSLAVFFAIILGACGGNDDKPNESGGAIYAFTRVDNVSCQLGSGPPTSGAADAWAAPAVFDGVTSGSLTGMLPIPGGGGAVAVAEQAGRIIAFLPQNASRHVALDVTDEVLNSGEKGFLSIAFAPDFVTSGFVYAAYSVSDSASADYKDLRVSRFTCTSDELLTCDRDSEHVVIIVERPADRDNHNGGQIFFGALDGELYISAGDSGGGGDPDGWAQDRTRLQGKLLRITPVIDGTYSIPATNPYVGNADGYREEIYAYGLRNPWRCTDDAVSGRVICADVGQGTYEEVDLVVPGGNYGWNKREGLHAYSGGVCTTDDECIDPVYEYAHESGRVSITGGFVYRGTAQQELVGAYVFADYLTGEVWRLDEASDGSWHAAFLTDGGGSLTSFGRDAEGEIYTLHGDGSIRHLIHNDDAIADDFPRLLSETGCFEDIGAQKLVAAALPYAINVPFWSDGALKERYVILPNGETMSVNADDAWDFPVGTIVIKQFTYAGAPIETRFLVQRTAGVWEGYSYAWDASGTDAALVSEDERVVAFGEHLHVYPSRSACQTCHTASRGHVLGLRTEQAHVANQIDAMVEAGFATTDGSDASAWPRLTTDVSASSDVRARSYLAANCAQCHNPADGRSPDMRYQTALADTGLCSVLTAGDSSTSPIVTQRLAVRGEPYGTIGAGQMPPLATFLVDTEGLMIVKDWIDAMDGETLPAALSCPQ